MGCAHLTTRYDTILQALLTMKLKKIEQGLYLRHGIISTNGETNLIQEGTDNVYINTETIDGKDTFH